MEELLKWLSSDSRISLIFTIIVGVFLIILFMMYIVAFFQGREISFWPPKIGEKPKDEKKSREVTAINVAKTNALKKVRESEIRLKSIIVVEPGLQTKIKHSPNPTVDNKISAKRLIAEIIADALPVQKNIDSWDLYISIPPDVIISEMDISEKTSILIYPKNQEVKVLELP